MLDEFLTVGQLARREFIGYWVLLLLLQKTPRLSLIIEIGLLFLIVYLEGVFHFSLFLLLLVSASQFRRLVEKV